MNFESSEENVFNSRLKKAIYYMAIPMVLGFSFVDYFYIRMHFFEFLYIRLLIVPVCIFIGLLYFTGIEKTRFSRFPMYICLTFLATYNAYMVCRTGYDGSMYYVGLLLVTIGTIGFFPMNVYQIFISSLITYTPYYLVLFLSESQLKSDRIVPISAFIFSTLFLSTFVNYLSSNARRKEHEALRSETQLRESLEETIKKKQEQAVIETVIGDNFSTAISNLIRLNPSSITGSSRRKTIPLFYDVVHSTTTSRTSNPYHFQDEMDEIVLAINEALKAYDLGLGQFLGDGQIAFANAPIDVDDHVFKTIVAAVEIQKFVLKRRPYTINRIGHELKLRVGMYFDFTFCKCAPKFGKGPYTVMGTPVNIASRICSAAEPDRILFPKSMLTELSTDQFLKIKSLGSIKAINISDLRSFEGQTFNLIEMTPFLTSDEKGECPKCRLGSLIEISKIDSELLVKCSRCSYQDLVSSKA